MIHSDWNVGDLGGSWILWLGLVILMLSRFGSRGPADGRALSRTEGRALDIVNEMYASGRISRSERRRFEADIRSGASRLVTDGRPAAAGSVSDRGGPTKPAACDR